MSALLPEVCFTQFRERTEKQYDKTRILVHKNLHHTIFRQPVQQFWHLNSRNTRFLFHQNQGGSTLWEKTHPFLHRSKAVDVQWKKPSQKGGGFKHHFMPPTMGSLEATNPSLNGSHLMITVNITTHPFSKHWKELNTIFVRYQQQTLLGNGEASLDPKMFCHSPMSEFCRKRHVERSTFRTRPAENNAPVSHQTKKQPILLEDLLHGLPFLPHTC